MVLYNLGWFTINKVFWSLKFILKSTLVLLRPHYIIKTSEPTGHCGSASTHRGLGAALGCTVFQNIYICTHIYIECWHLKTKPLFKPSTQWNVMFTDFSFWMDKTPETVFSSFFIQSYPILSFLVFKLILLMTFKDLQGDITFPIAQPPWIDSNTSVSYKRIV